MEDGNTTLEEFDQSDRWTLALTWTPTEYSRLRAQWARADIAREGASEEFDYFYLQFILSLGAHGAHKY